MGGVQCSFANRLTHCGGSYFDEERSDGFSGRAALEWSVSSTWFMLALCALAGYDEAQEDWMASVKGSGRTILRERALGLRHTTREMVDCGHPILTSHCEYLMDVAG